MKKYFKIIYTNNEIGLFSSNSQKAILYMGELIAAINGKIFEIPKREFERLENEIP